MMRFLFVFASSSSLLLLRSIRSFSLSNSGHSGNDSAHPMTVSASSLFLFRDQGTHSCEESEFEVAELTMELGNQHHSI
jgi:hypothetical protein